MSSFSEQPLPNPSVLFRDYVVRSVRAALSRIDVTTTTLPDDVRERALHCLSFSFKLAEAWPVTRDLLLAMAAPMEQGGHRDDWIPYLEQGVQQSHLLGDVQAEAELRLHLGYLFQLLGKFREAYVQVMVSVKQFDEVDNFRNQAKALNRLAYIARLQRRYEEAEYLLQDASKLLEEDDPEWANSFFVQGAIAFDKRDWATATHYFQGSLALWEKLGDKRRIAWGLRNLGPALQAQRRYDEAIACYTKAITLLEDVRDIAQQSIAYMNLGIVYLLLEQPQKALELFMLGEPVLYKTHDELHLAMNYCNRGIAHRDLRQWEQAENAFLSSLERWKQIGNVEAIVNVLDELGVTYLEQSLPEKALTIFREALEQLARIENEPGYQHRLETVQKHLLQAGQTPI